MILEVAGVSRATVSRCLARCEGRAVLVSLWAETGRGAAPIGARWGTPSQPGGAPRRDPRSRGDRTRVRVIGLVRGTPQDAFALAGSACCVACRYPDRGHADRGRGLGVRGLGGQAGVKGSAIRLREPGWSLIGVGRTTKRIRTGALIGVEGAQPIRPYEPSISIVWTQGEPCIDTDCALLTAALAAGDAAIIECGHWGVYNGILRVGRAGQDAHYFLADVRDSEPIDAA